MARVSRLARAVRCLSPCHFSPFGWPLRPEGRPRNDPCASVRDRGERSRAGRAACHTSVVQLLPCHAQGGSTGSTGATTSAPGRRAAG
jgi:hypothetical protein